MEGVVGCIGRSVWQQRHQRQLQLQLVIAKVSQAFAADKLSCKPPPSPLPLPSFHLPLATFVIGLSLNPFFTFIPLPSGHIKCDLA